MKQPEDNMTADLLDNTSKRGRKALPAAEVVDANFSHEAAAQAGQAATAITLREAEITQAYGDGLAYQRDRVVHEAQFFMAQSAEAMLQAGKRFIQLKEHESHGDFLRIVEDQLGVERRTAQRMMAAAAKFLAPQLASKASTLSLLGRSKMFELLTEDDGDLEALADGGTLAGLKIDEIDAMSVRELRTALRDHKQIIEAKDKVLADRIAKVDQLEEKIAKPFKPSKNAIAKTREQQEQLDELRAAMTAAELAFARMAVVVATVQEASESEPMVKAGNDSLAYLIARIKEISDTHQLTLDTSDAAFGLKPEWS